MRTGTKLALRRAASAPPKMKPRDSIPDHGVDVLADEALGDEIERHVERARIGEERRDVLEEDARLGEIRHVAEVRPEVALGALRRLPVVIGHARES